MKLVCWLVLSMCIANNCISQTRIDSLRVLLEDAKRKHDNGEISYCLSHIGWEFLTLHQFDTALSCYYKSIHYSTVNVDLTASTYECMGVAFNFKGFPDSSIAYYNRALLLYQERKDTAHSIVIENNLSIIYKNIGLYEKAFESAFSAATQLERKEPGRELASCYNTIGALYAKTGDHSNALVYYNKSLTIRKKIVYIKGIGQSYNNIGEEYSAMRLYDSALSNLLRSRKIKIKIDDINALGTTLNFLGVVYLELGKVNEAKIYLTESRNIKSKSGERLEEAIALNNLGKADLLLKNTAQAEKYLNEAYDLIGKTSALDELRKNLELQVWLCKIKLDYPRALKHTEELMKVKDSLLNKDKAESLITMQTKYETEKKEQQISILKQNEALQHVELAAKKRWITSLAVIVVLLFFIGLLLYYSYIISQHGKKKVEILLKELHHRVKNNLQILSSILSLQSLYLKDESAVQAIKSSESRVNSMALIHKKLYNDDSNQLIDMKEYISELSSYLLHTYGYTPQNIALIVKSDDINLDVDIAIPVGLILNELVSNALKYAYYNHQNPQLTINLSLQGKRELIVTVNDNGVGISKTPSQETTQSFGLKLVSTLMQELKGKLTSTITTGTSYFLQIPLD